MSQPLNFSRTTRQDAAVDLLSSAAKDIMLYGGSRSGKTFILVYALIIRAAKCRSRHAILRGHFNHAKRSIWLDTLPKVLTICFPDLTVHWNRSDYYITLPNKSEIWIGGLDSKERTEKILGTEFSTLYFNETSQLDYSSILMAKTRLAEKNILKKKTYYDANPPSKSHWSYWLFEKGIDPIDEEPIENPEDYASLLMNPMDNIENLDEEYIKLLEKMPEKDRKRFLLGQYTDVDDGAVYYSFNQDDHVKEFTRPQTGTTFAGMDFNVDPMTCVLLMQSNNKIYVFDEIYLKNSDTYRMRDQLIRRGYEGVKIAPDSTGKNRKTSGKSDFNILKEKGFHILPVMNPFVTDRVNNVNRLLQEGRLIIHPKCKKLINDLSKVAWKDNKLDQKTDKSLTHISDALGYILWKLEPINSSHKLKPVFQKR